MKRRLIKFSNYSFCITLPKQAVDSFGWKKGEELDVDFDGSTGRMVVTKPKNNKFTKPNKIDKKKTTKSTQTEKSASKVKPIPALKW